MKHGSLWSSSLPYEGWTGIIIHEASSPRRVPGCALSSHALVADVLGHAHLN